MERFVVILNGFQSLTVTKRSILDVAAAVDRPLLRKMVSTNSTFYPTKSLGPFIFDYENCHAKPHFNKDRL